MQTMDLIWVFLIVWATTAYLVARVAYAQGMRDKWEEVTKDYICLHKGVVVNRVKVRGKIDVSRKQKSFEKRKQFLDKRRKKK